MNPSRIAIIVVAGVAALLLAFVVHGMIGKSRSPAAVAAAPPPGPLMTRVLTAKTDLAIGERLSADNMAWTPWPVGTVNDAYITDGSAAAPKPASGADSAMKQAGAMVKDIANGGGPKMQGLVGDIVRDPIFAGEPIISRKIVRSGDSSYMAVRLPEGMRAMTVSVTAETGAGGFIEPGDRIDILSSHADASHGAAGMVAEVVLSNVQVLATDQRTDTPKNTVVAPASTLTLEVPAGDVENLVRAKANGQLMMALRSYADIGGGARADSARPTGDAVRIFRGGGPAELVTAQ